MDPFIGSSFGLSAEGLQAATSSLGVKATELWAVVDVETTGCGFLPDRRPRILYERHVFYRLTEGKHRDIDISNPIPGGYGAGAAHQYERLAKAIALDRTAALQSASWGLGRLGQVMGENFAAGGFSDVESFVTAMSESEDAQLKAMSSFMIHRKLDAAVASHDWKTVARAYSGPNYAKRGYDTQLRGSFQKLSAGVMPDLELRTVQLYLTYAGFHPGSVDGILGRFTSSALVEFKSKFSLGTDDSVDAAVLAKLKEVALGRGRRLAAAP